ncbi:baseplate J/gp47 family protein [Paraburkholderia tropica]|uniref:baseplate J/gp47 family protein n=1 Tax=Paraburkholderia tropica TaxID=92647 RepID=UPI002AB2B2AB|nr:baseplate J/gp47 family protein [Paraburkholderia tropica]
MITVMDIDGLRPADPTDLNNQLTTLVSSEVPGYTADLPGSLIEDLSGTGTGVIALCDQARVELVNSITPYGANQFLLNQLGVQKGIRPGLPSNTSVYLQFTGTPGFVVNRGFTVSDGTNQVVLQDTVAIPAAGKTSQVFAVANNSGTFALPRNTVTQLITSIPDDITLSVTNPSDGFPATTSESVDSYRARVLDAEAAVVQGMLTTLKANLRDVTGVQSRLVSVVQQTEGWAVLCGGGDTYAVATAIFNSVFDISLLQGSSLAITGAESVTSGEQVQFTFNLSPGYGIGSTFSVQNANPTEYNGDYQVATASADGKTLVCTPTTVASSYPAYVSGAELVQNPRDAVVTINDYPDTYNVPYILPPSQTVGVVVAWNTDAPNIVADDTVAQAIQPVVVNYINSVVVGKPINTLQLNNLIQAAIVNIVPIEYLSHLAYTFTINGQQVTTEELIYGDPEGYFTTSLANVSVTRG